MPRMALPPLQVATRNARELVEITAELRAALRQAGAGSGILVAHSMHTTAGLTVQENADPDVARDFLVALANAVPDAPPRGAYRHAEGNSPAHVMTSLVGTSVTLLVEEGDLVLGTWQGVFLCEFDGPRTRTVRLRLVQG